MDDSIIAKRVKLCFFSQVVERNQHARSEARDAKVREYFYGIKNNLFPHTFDIKFSDIKIYKIGGEYGSEKNKCGW